jgi:transcriptional regulator with XRE-family HTH domain
MTLHRSSFGMLLRERRLSAGLTQASLAELASVSTRAIQDLERGLSQPHRDTLSRIVEALGLSTDERRALEAATSPGGAPGRTPAYPGAACSYSTISKKCAMNPRW